MAGFDPMSVLVASQVTLSFKLPFGLTLLFWFTYQEDIMGTSRTERGRPRVSQLLLASSLF